MIISSTLPTPLALVIVETTMPVGGIRNELKPILDQANKRYSLAYCPIRAMSGSAIKDMREKYSRVVSGIDRKSTTLAKQAMESFLKNKVIFPINI